MIIIRQKSKAIINDSYSNKINYGNNKNRNINPHTANNKTDY